MIRQTDQRNRAGAKHPCPVLSLFGWWPAATSQLLPNPGGAGSRAHDPPILQMVHPIHVFVRRRVVGGDQHRHSLLLRHPSEQGQDLPPAAAVRCSPPPWHEVPQLRSCHLVNEVLESDSSGGSSTATSWLFASLQSQFIKRFIDPLVFFALCCYNTTCRSFRERCSGGVGNRYPCVG